VTFNALLVLGLILALGMIGWGLSGVFSGRVLTKSYGIVDGKRRYYRLVSRQQEPLWFWTLCGVYAGIGMCMLLALYVVAHHVR